MVAANQGSRADMADATTAPSTTDTTTTPPLGSVRNPAPNTKDDPTTDDTSNEVEKWKAMSKKHEAEARANAGAAKKLAEIEEAAKSDAQKAADRVIAAEKSAADAMLMALRFKIAAKFQIGDEDAELFLNGPDEETLTKQAQRLAGREADRKKQGNFVAREGTTTTAVEGDERAVARALFQGS